MAALFADLPEAIENTVEIARRCSYRPRPRKPILPQFVVGTEDTHEAEAAELRAASRSGPRAPPRRHSGASSRRERGGLQEAPRLRTRRHHAHEVSGLLPDRVRLHQMDEGARHPGRAGPRFGRGLGGGLVAHDHGPRSDPLRASLRALPEPRTRVDAGLRHRLLPGSPRRGDPICARQIRRKPRRADHYLREAAGARRAARRGPRPADALWPSRPALQNGAEQPGEPGDARPGHRRRAGAAGGARPRAHRRATARHRAEARRALPPRLHPRGGRGDRRPRRLSNSCRSIAIRAPTCSSPSST